ncbi:MAG: hypothetical protein A2086_14185 [Spirochaetes bacterium GWD1_27_9]|nr:MAG: hypothetical protein A2Y34_05490 [Spirochaetes bacterium GWC1_27_15]OHD35459.1 MAG: hypothetical protein A2086_14185 [Spirochaetes bacterium GWD1_27_9]
MQTIYLNGSISLDEQDQSRMNYIITSLVDGVEISITDILDTIYNSKNTINKLIRVMGRIYHSQHTFFGFETLHITKDKTGVYGYHIGNFQLERQLYELAEIGEEVEIILEDYTNSIGGFIHTTNGTTEEVTYATQKAM